MSDAGNRVLPQKPRSFRVSADTADVPKPDSLAPAPGAGIELQEQ